MTFGYPQLLWFLALPVLLAIWESARRGPIVTLPFDHGRQRAGKWLARMVLPASLLPAALLAIAVLIACRPLALDKPRQKRRMTNIEFLLDVSGSMASPFGPGSQYDAAMSAIEEFTNRRKGDAFGLTIFGNEVLRWTPLTKDLAAIRGATPFLRPELLPHHFGGTEIGKALRFCGKTIPERGEGDRMIILLTDGISADLGPAVSRQVGAELAGQQITLHAVYIGQGPPPTDLYDLTRPTGGRVDAVSSPAGFRAAFERIDQMQRVQLEPEAPRQVDAFGPLALAGLVLLAVFQLTSLGWRYTPW